MRWTWRGLALAGLLAVSCSTDSTTDMVFDPQPDEGDTGNTAKVVTFTSVQQDIFDPSCALSGCHRDVQIPKLTAGQAYDNVVAKTSSRGMPYVDPGNPDNSYLYRKIAGTSDIAGARMPFGGPFLTTTQIEAVAAWIERGAPDD